MRVTTKVSRLDLDISTGIDAAWAEHTGYAELIRSIGAVHTLGQGFIIDLDICPRLL